MPWYVWVALCSFVVSLACIGWGLREAWRRDRKTKAQLHDAVAKRPAEAPLGARPRPKSFIES
jgi:hypothetical protein